MRVSDKDSGMAWWTSRRWWLFSAAGTALLAVGLFIQNTAAGDVAAGIAVAATLASIAAFIRWPALQRRRAAQHEQNDHG